MRTDRQQWWLFWIAVVASLIGAAVIVAARDYSIAVGAVPFNVIVFAVCASAVLSNAQPPRATRTTFAELFTIAVLSYAVPPVGYLLLQRL